MTATCETCRWWAGGECRRYPPTLIVPGTWTGGPAQEPVTRFPDTARWQWCGEHQPEEPTP